MSILGPMSTKRKAHASTFSRGARPDGPISRGADDSAAEALSAHMRRIRKVDTKPELRVRRVVHALGFRYRLHRRDLPGTPDLVLPRLRKVVFVHGCFWHQHPGCRLAKRPRARPEYWLPKLERNVARDHACRRALAATGWEVLVIWECETSDAQALTARLLAFLKATNSV
jgi:DNA mismatch endonuclease, patch repair protein